MFLCVMAGGAVAAARAVEEDVQKTESSAEQSTGRLDLYIFIKRTFVQYDYVRIDI